MRKPLRNRLLWLLSSGLLLGLSPIGTEAATWTRRVVSSTDDAEEEGSDGDALGPGGMYIVSSDLELVRTDDSPDGGTQTIGMRFNSVAIPRGAFITAAYLTFRAVTPDPPNTNNGATTLTIRGQAADNAATFTATYFDISSRPTTTSTSSWSPSAWTAGVDVDSPSVATVVQEIVSRAGWASGNSLVIIITGTGSRSAAAYDGDPANAPKLTIVYRPRRVMAFE